jgi:hypothetical protein
LGWDDLANVFIAFPEWGGLERDFCTRLLKKLSTKHWLGRRSDILLEASMMEPKRFGSLCHWMTHSDVKDGGLCMLDAYSLFPVLGIDDKPKPDKDTRVVACCFLKPTSPWPFQNALVASTNKGELAVHVLLDSAYVAVVRFQNSGKIVSLVASPLGGCLLLLDEGGHVHLMLLERGLAKLTSITGVTARKREMRPDMFLSEEEFLTEVQHGKDRNLVVHRADGLTGRISTEVYATGVRGGSTVTIRKGGWKTREYLFAKISCHRNTHYCCGVEVSEEPKRPERRKVFSAFFREAIVADFVLSSDKTVLYVAVLSGLTTYLALRDSVQLVQKPSNPRCLSNFGEKLTALVIYSLKLPGTRGLSGSAAFHPIFCKKTCYTNSLPQVLSTAWSFYLNFAIPAAKRCFLKCSSDLLAVKMGSNETRFIWLGVDGQSSDFVYMAGTDRDVFDLSEEFHYLASFSSNEQHNLCAGKFCQGYSYYTVEEATRPVISHDELGQIDSIILPQVCCFLLNSTVIIPELFMCRPMEDSVPRCQRTELALTWHCLRLTTSCPPKKPRSSWE